MKLRSKQKATKQPASPVKKRTSTKRTAGPGVADGASTGGANKFDAEKVPLDLLPFAALEEVAAVLALGAGKYGRYNWRGGMDWCRLLGACLRHLFAWAKREEADPESGLSHLAHAACCILFLIDYEKRGAGQDDRA